MAKCKCGHQEADHRASYPCHEIIHYPSEDYPCFCDDFIPSADKVLCSHCGHSRDKHALHRRCRPADGVCDCLGFDLGR
jgi:hypothetical protein